MNRTEFNKIVEETFDSSLKVFKGKSNEYASEENVFENFEKSVGAFFPTREQAAFGFMMKHFTSITDMVKDSNGHYGKGYIDEKFGDMINYLLLLKGMIVENQYLTNEYRNDKD